MLDLNDIEARVLGAMVEKQICTPDYYPLTLNSLTNACNQKSNRDPVMDFDEKVVLRALDRMREDKLVAMIHQANSRVPKYEHRLDVVLGLSQQEVVVMCELMLRGPQTIGELRGHCKRMVEFDSLEEVEAIVQHLAARNEGQMLKQLPRQSGRKESRYAHLLAGEPVLDEAEYAPQVEPIRVSLQAEDERIAKLEEQVQAMEAQLTELQEAFATFKQQFE